MLLLPNGCTASDLNVYPDNWKTKEASLKKTWYIFYRFYDPTARDKYPNGKLVRIKGVNRVNDLKDRQAVIKSLLEHELMLLKEKGYNPITKQFMIEEEEEEDTSYLVPPSTLLIQALTKAKDNITCAPSTKSDLKSIINSVRQAAEPLRYSNKPIGSIETRHIKNILEYLLKNHKKFTTNRYNKVRAYLLMLFKELRELGAVKSNPVTDISLKTPVKKLRAVLSDDERKRIDSFLKQNYYTFWRFLHIFFHSGAREVELVSLQGKDVDLNNQRFKIVVKKGKEYREVWKTIKDMALPLWKRAMINCKPDDYVFSKGLVPGEHRIRTEQITRRWRDHVKKKLGVEADFYSLKHLNTTEMLDHLAELDVAKMNAASDVAKMNDHTTTTMVETVYDVRRAERQHERLKKVGNKFV
jgi:integrase